MQNSKFKAFLLTLFIGGTLTSNALFNGNYLMVNLVPGDKSDEVSMWMCDNLPHFKGKVPAQKEHSHSDRQFTLESNKEVKTGDKEIITFTSDDSGYASIFQEEAQEDYFSGFGSGLK